jgi:hypothetical protein
MGKRRVGKQNHRYGNVAFNALTHGVLSRQVVLPHESPEEFNELLFGLMREYRPQGATETHLVEELAAILWRKRRVLLAEGASINESLSKVFILHDDLPGMAQPFKNIRSNASLNVRALLGLSTSELKNRIDEAMGDFRSIESALTKLKGSGCEAEYQTILEELSQDCIEWWGEYSEANMCKHNADDLAKFINTKLFPTYREQLALLSDIPKIRAQILGLAMYSERLEKLSRYETHLDRKFERALGMLLKLKELRKADNSDVKAEASSIRST